MKGGAKAFVGNGVKKDLFFRKEPKMDKRDRQDGGRRK